MLIRTYLQFVILRNSREPLNISTMALNVQPGGFGISKDLEASSRLRAVLASLQKIKLKVKTARDKLEDAILGATIPDWFRKYLTFYRLHLTYFALITILGTSILYIAHRSDAGERRFSLVDTIFNTVSIVTVTGITSVRIADFSLFDRILLLILMTLGSPVFTSLLPLYVRRFYFFRHHRMYVKERLKDISSCSGLGGHCQNVETPRLNSFPSVNPGPDEEDVSQMMARRNSDATSDRSAQSPKMPLVLGSSDHSMNHDSRSQLANRETQRFFLTMDVVKAFHKPKIDMLDGRDDHVQDSLGMDTEYTDDAVIELKPGLGIPQSPFNIMMTVEHQGLVALCWLVPTYLVVIQSASFGLNLLILYVSPHAAKLLKERRLNTIFFSISTTIAAFTNSGVPAHDDNLIPFRSQSILLLLYTLVSLMGSLLYPPCIRLVIWVLHSLASKSRKPVYSYLLNHPRRCFTHLYPCRQSIWLCLTVIGFTAVQLVFFCTLDWNSEALLGLEPVAKVVDGIYQSVSVRNAGGAVIVISELSSTMLVLYLFMMLIAAYPLVLLRQNSTEYEHADLGIYDKQREELTDNSLTFQSRKLLVKDSVYLCIILFLICLIENKKIEDDPLNYSIFNIVFEVVSAYGGVGMSIGYNCNLRLPRDDQQPSPCTDVPYSFSGKWSPTGRIVLAIAMFMGRHRGLPDDIDSAIKLPSFALQSALPSRVSIAGSAGRSYAQSPSAPAAPGRYPFENNLDPSWQGGHDLHQQQSHLDDNEKQSGSSSLERGRVSIESIR